MSVRWDEERIEEKWASALVLKNVSDFVIDSFSGRQGLKNASGPAMLLDDASEGTIRNSRADANTDTFIHVMGAGSRNILLRDNWLKHARKEITFGEKNLSNAVVRER